MFTKQSTFIIHFIMTVALTVLILLVSSVTLGQQPLQGQPQGNNGGEVAGNNSGMKPAASESVKKVLGAKAPVLVAFMGVNVGMTAEECRKKLGNLKDKGELQDFFVFSELKSAQVFYDSKGKVKAISIDYLGADSEAPSPESVLGVSVQPRADGSIYQLKRYPEAGYWIAYSRTAGDNPIISVTMQKM